MILMVQFRRDKSKVHEQECIGTHIPPGEDITFCSAFDSVDISRPEKLLRGISKLVLGGSGELNVTERDINKHVAHALAMVDPLVRHVLTKNFPTLGICLGHQIIGHIAGGKVVQDLSQAETGSFEIIQTSEGQEDWLFAGVPTPFAAIELHKENITTLPPRAKILAHSARCAIQALAYGDNIRTTQFHAEMDDARLEERLALYPAYRNFVGAGTESAHAGSLVLRNFFQADALGVDNP